MIPILGKSKCWPWPSRARWPGSAHVDWISKTCWCVADPLYISNQNLLPIIRLKLYYEPQLTSTSASFSSLCDSWSSNQWRISIYNFTTHHTHVDGTFGPEQKRSGCAAKRSRTKWAAAAARFLKRSHPLACLAPVNVSHVSLSKIPGRTYSPSECFAELLNPIRCQICPFLLHHRSISPQELSPCHR